LHPTTLLAFIPARSGSVRVPDKNARVIAGENLIERKIKAALSAGGLDAVAFSSDSDRYIELAHQTGLDERYKRPGYLAGDDAGAAEAVLDYLDWRQNKDGAVFTHVVILQPTNPFFTAPDITAAIIQWRESGKASLVSVTRAAARARFVVSVDRETGKTVREGKDGKREFYVLDGGIFISPVELIRDMGRFWDEASEFFIKDYPIFYDIDTEMDFAAAESLISAGVRDT